jgi:hypothetical protein
MAGGHGGRVAVAQVADQETLVSPYRRSLFEASSSRALNLAASCHVTRDNLGSAVTPMRATLRRQATKARTLRLTSYLLRLMTLAGIAGCAPANLPKAPVQPASINAGTILSMRAVAPRGSVEPLRAALLADGGGHDDGNRSLVEFIVRVDDGATLSIVQTNEPGFRKGDRVIILRDDRTRLARPG